MISVGIDVSKGKSTVCILKPYGEIVCSPFEVVHVEKELDNLDNLLKKLDGELRIVMEATGIYHLPVLTYLQEKGYFVSVINPFLMKRYAKENSPRGAKTDRLDSIMIANYGIEKWFKLRKHESDGAVYSELKLLGRRYRYYMEIHVKSLQEMTHILDYVMPGVKKLFSSWNEANGKDKLSDFAERFWHYDLITAMTLDEFVDEYLTWAKENLEQNGFKGKNYVFTKTDVISWLYEKVKTSSDDEKQKFDIIILDPPTFSNSKSTANVLDINRDWPKLIEQCIKLLTPNGTLYFSTNSTKLIFDKEKIPQKDKVSVTDITQPSIPKDFEGTKCHKAWEIKLIG